MRSFSTVTARASRLEGPTDDEAGGSFAGLPAHQAGGEPLLLVVDVVLLCLDDDPDVSARIQHKGGLLTVGTTRNGTLTLKTDATGLRYAVVLPDTGAGRDIAAVVRRGAIS